MTEYRFTTAIPTRNGSAHPPDDREGWEVVTMTQGLTTGGGSASPLVVLLWKREY